MLEAGFSRQDISPSGRVPLAGYFTLFSDRSSEGLRDPLYVRALALREGGLSVLLLVYDLLLVSEEMYRDLQRRTSRLGIKLIVAATHTHSGPGGYWDSFIARRALGSYRPGLLQYFCEAGQQAAEEAIDDLSPAKWISHRGHIPELAINRRDEKGPVDDGLWSLRLSFAKRNRKDLILAGFPGHPVIVAEREPKMISADFPGEVVRRIERDEHVEAAIFVNGALGAVDVLFPDGPVSASDNLEMQAGPIAEEALKVRGKRLRQKGSLRFAVRELPTPVKADVHPCFDDQPIASMLTAPFAFLANSLFDQAAVDRWRIQGFAIGDTVFIGTPADLGVSVSLAIQRHAAELGFGHCFVSSQCSGYIGYIHRRNDYSRLPAAGTRQMAIYENAMGIYGHDMGERLIGEARTLLDELADKREKKG